MPRSDGRPTAQEKRDAAIAARGGKEKVREANGGATDVEHLNSAAIKDPGSVAAASGEILKPQSAGGKVIVALKLGIAYFDIQLCKPVEKFEQNMQGGRLVPGFDRIGQVVRLRGTAYPRGTPPDGFPEKPEIVSGAALTYGVDAQFWRDWVTQNHLNPVVMNRMIFAHESISGITAMAREYAGEKSGLDPIDPKNMKKDPRIPRSSREDVSNVETEEGRAAKARNAA